MGKPERKEPIVSPAEQDALSDWQEVLGFNSGTRKWAKTINRRRARRRHRDEVRQWQGNVRTLDLT